MPTTRSSIVSVLATLVILTFASTPVAADPVTIGCSSRAEGGDAATAPTYSFGCTAGSTSAEAPGAACSACPEPAALAFNGIDATHGTLEGAGLCAASGPCVGNDDLGLSYSKNETPKSKEYTGHVTLLK